VTADPVIYYGDARDSIVPDHSIQAIVTSPPYWGLRRYGDSDREIGIGSLEEYLTDIEEVGLRMYDALKDDGIFWLNLGDTAAGSGGAGGDFKSTGSKSDFPKYKQGESGIPKGQWCMVPQRAVLRLQEQGWYLRQWITWDKGQLRPESSAHVRRPKISSEVIVMLTKGTKYKYNAEFQESETMEAGNVWHFPAVRGKRHHMAPFPAELPRRCIELSTDLGDRVLDPFMGNGTTVETAQALGREAVGIDLYSYDTTGLVGASV
jgi:site-specific DNA-methyltransferase (cytosine-N4-specific)